ncbi:hypothetical protein SCALM49S_04913 [Streptomyces californicus]
MRGLEGALAADRDDGVQSQVRDVAAGPLDPVAQMRGLDPEEPRIVPPRARMPPTASRSSLR